MPTYVSLLNWTDQGIRNVRDTVQRYERSQELQNKHGVRLEYIYWTVGPHDLVGEKEEKLIERLGDEYRDYMKYTGSFLTKLKDPS